MRADSHGLFTRTSIYQTGDGDALLEVARKRLSNGRTLGMSIGFRTVKDRWDRKQQARIIEDLDLVEYSFLASPALAANPQAQTTAVKRRAAKQTSLIASSYEDLQQDLSGAAAEALGLPYGVFVCATYPDHVVVMVDPAQTDTEEESQYWDIPYTLDADGEPVLGTPQPVQPAFVDGAAKARAEAHLETRANEGKETPVKVMTAEMKAALPDSAFAFVEQGTKDDGGLTTPRTKRHFVHHTADGRVDEDLLRQALADAHRSEYGDNALPHLERHAKAIGLGEAKSAYDDAHEPIWTEGVAPQLLLLNRKLAGYIEEVVADRRAMERLGIDTKAGARINREMRGKLKDLHESLSHILAWADAIEEGEDGKRRVDFYKHKLALVDLEVSV